MAMLSIWLEEIIGKMARILKGGVELGGEGTIKGGVKGGFSGEALI
jgi:hypothetical protein